MSTRAAVPLVGIVLAVLAVLAASPPAAALHWSGQGTFGPNTTIEGIPTVFTFHLTNAASDSLDVYSVFVHFCWNSGASGFYFKADDQTTVAVSGGASHDFTGTVDVSPTASGACTVTIYVSGQAVNDVIRQTAAYQTTITIQASQPILLYGLIGAIALIIILVVIVLRQRRRPPTSRP